MRERVARRERPAGTGPGHRPGGCHGGADRHAGPQARERAGHRLGDLGGAARGAPAWLERGIVGELAHTYVMVRTTVVMRCDA